MSAAHAQLRNAFLIQGLMLLTIGAMCVVGWLVSSINPAVPIFMILGGVSVLVLCVWSLVLSVRAARAGEKWRWAGAVWALVGVELSIPSIAFWCFAANLRTGSLLMPALMGVILPFVAISGLFVLFAAIVARHRVRKALIYTIFALLYLPIPLLIAPGALYLVSVLSSFESLDKSNENWVMRTTPELAKDAVDRVCDSSKSATLYLFHILLSEHGRLSRERTLKNLTSADSVVSFAAWDSLENYRSGATREIAMAVGLGRLKVSNEATLRSIGEYLILHADENQIAEIFREIEQCPVEVRSSIIYLIDTRQELIPYLENVVIKGKWKEPDVISRLANSIPGEGDKKQVYYAWARLSLYGFNSPSAQESSTCAKTLIDFARGPEPLLRRTAAIALSDCLKFRLMRTPFPDAMTDKGTLVPMTLDESEEIESLCNKAEAEIAGLSQAEKKK
jgi:hypothetical protein